MATRRVRHTAPLRVLGDVRSMPRRQMGGGEGERFTAWLQAWSPPARQNGSRLGGPPETHMSVRYPLRPGDALARLQQRHTLRLVRARKG